MDQEVKNQAGRTGRREGTGRRPEKYKVKNRLIEEKKKEGEGLWNPILVGSELGNSITGGARQRMDPHLWGCEILQSPK